MWRALRLLLVLWLVPASAAAHAGHRSYCSVQTVPGGIDVVLEVPTAQLAERADGSKGPHDDASILAQGPRLRLELEGHLRATTPGGECRVQSTGPRLQGTGERRAVFQLGFACPAGPVTLGNDYLIAQDPLAESICAIDGGAYVFRKGSVDRLIGTPPSLPELLFGFVKLGAEHVLAGIDHVLFVLSLLLGAASAMGKSPGRTLQRVAWLVTGFTLGHSVTLIVAALGILTLPSRFTESMIALSIVIVAVHNVLDETPRGRAATSALFGLIHGFGFASALAETGLPRQGTVPALLAFNVGIELAQLSIVLVCFPALAWARRHPWFRSRLLVPACAVIAGLGSLWFIERALDLSLLPWLGG